MPMCTRSGPKVKPSVVSKYATVLSTSRTPSIGATCQSCLRSICPLPSRSLYPAGGLRAEELRHGHGRSRLVLVPQVQAEPHRVIGCEALDRAHEVVCI